MTEKNRDYDLVIVDEGTGEPIEAPINVNTQAFLDEVTKVESSITIELFEIDTRRYAGEILRFHNGKTLQGDVVYAAKTYKSFPFEISDFDIKGDGTLPRPKMTFANIDGYVSQLIQGKDDFVGLQVKRIRTFLKYIDAINFVDNINPFGEPDASAKFPDDEFVINQKTQENKETVTFELVSALDLEEARVPTRIMYSHYCPWTYRGIGCHYGNKQVHNQWPSDPNCVESRGLPVGDEYDKGFAYDYKFHSDGNASWQSTSSAYVYSGYYDSTGIYSSGDWVKIANLDHKDRNYELIFMAKPTGYIAKEYPGTNTAIPFYNVSGKDPRFDKENWVQDQCSKTLSGCAIRFQKNYNGLPFGGFPGIDKYQYQ